MKRKIMSSTILTNETGRSMVEMLGVLAIVGVLSVGGVYGYGVAMKKHKANELLHQASMLAATISAQAMSNDGKLPETITDFGSTSYGKFPTTVGETADKTGFTITISELDGSVCSQLKKGGMVQNVDCNPDAKTATITYYKNLASNPAEGEKSPTGGNNTSPCANNTEKCDGGMYYVCENGKWVSQSLPSEKVCNGDTLEPTDSCSSYYLLCLNGTTYFCAYPSNTWEVLEDQTGYGSDRCALGTCEEGQETCIDDVYYYCCGVTWIGEEGCCTGGAVADGKCENGTYYSCCGGEWTEEGDNVGCCLGNGSNVADIDTQRCLEMSGMYIQQTCVSSPFGREWLANAGPDCCDENGNLVTCTCDNWAYAGMHPDECS